jgi:hypothetical protein
MVDAKIKMFSCGSSVCVNSVPRYCGEFFAGNLFLPQKLWLLGISMAKRLLMLMKTLKGTPLDITASFEIFVIQFDLRV